MLDIRLSEYVVIPKIVYSLAVMPDLIPAKDGIVDRHPVQNI
jgi:hypothetical protein